MVQCHWRRLTRQVRWGLVPAKEISFPLCALELGVGRSEGSLTVCRFLKLLATDHILGGGGRGEYCFLDPGLPCPEQDWGVLLYFLF